MIEERQVAARETRGVENTSAWAHRAELLLVTGRMAVSSHSPGECTSPPSSRFRPSGVRAARPRRSSGGCSEETPGTRRPSPDAAGMPESMSVPGVRACGGTARACAASSAQLRFRFARLAMSNASQECQDSGFQKFLKRSCYRVTERIWGPCPVRPRENRLNNQ